MSAVTHNAKGTLQIEEASKKSWDVVGTHFLLEIGDLTKSALFGGPTLPPSGAVL